MIRNTVQKNKRLSLIGVLCLAMSAHAEELSVELKDLEAIRTQEAVDEIFISVTEFPAKQAPHYYQIPAYPTHWVSKYLHNVKNVVIWQKNFTQCEPIDLLISFVEQDMAPWNMDDLIGSVQLKVNCVNGKVVKEWVIPNTKNTMKVPNEENTFSLFGEKAEYRAIFKLENKTKPPTQADFNQEYNQKQTDDFNIAPMF